MARPRDPGPEVEVWYSGRFVSRWADPRAAASLADTFSRYDADDLRRSLLATMDLFAWLSEETAARLGLPPPGVAGERVREWVNARFAEPEVKGLPPGAPHPAA
jgi:hypothetical protein